MKIISFPISVNNECAGYLVCSGLQFKLTDDQRKESLNKLTSLGFSKTDLMKHYDQAKISNYHAEEYVLSFINMVAKDIVLYYGELFDKYNRDIEGKLIIDSRDSKRKYESIIGRSLPMKKIFDKLDLIETSESPVLIIGETGTGKELIATAIHYYSVRRDKPFVIQNCSVFSDAIMSSELFGHQKGAFTGAVNEKKGLFEVADGGTLFLDEIGDLGLDVQGKLLRVLENGTFYRVGGNEQKEVDVRIITATNKDLSKMVDEGLFRRDFYFRINTHRIDIPPLRERKSDIKHLFYSFYEYYVQKNNSVRKSLNPEIFSILNNHKWPGNVRELRNAVENLIVMSSNSPAIEPEHLHLEETKTGTELSFKNERIKGKGETLKCVVSFTDMNMIRTALQKNNWNKTKTARELGISRASLNRKIEKYNITKQTA